MRMVEASTGMYVCTYLYGPLKMCLILRMWKLCMEDEHALVGPVPQVPHKDRHSGLAGFHNVSQIAIREVCTGAKGLQRNAVSALKLDCAVACKV